MKDLYKKKERAYCHHAMAECHIPFHSDRKKAEIYNSLHLRKSKKFPALSQKLRLKPLTSNQSAESAIRIIIPSNTAIKVIKKH